MAKQPWLWVLGALVVLFLCGITVLGGILWAFSTKASPEPTLHPAQAATWAAATLQALAPPDQAEASPPQPIPTTAAETAPAVAATFTATAVSTPTPVPTATAVPTNTPVPSPTLRCLAASFVKDVTVPDGTVYPPGKPFAKTWRLRNEGACTWTTAFQIYFDDGDAMGAPPAVNLPHAVDPGETVDVTVEFQAPTTEGTYKSFWKIRSDEGYAFGIGDTADKPFWVKIRVELPTYSLFDMAPEAQWVSHAGEIPYGGAPDDSRGFVRDVSNHLLEDGSSPDKVLEMHPTWKVHGAISGTYPEMPIYTGHRFVAKIGFLALEGGGCGVGKVAFQLNYQDAEGLHPLGEWIKSCDGSLQDVEVDLSPLAGKTVQLILAVMAAGSPDQDWAVWVDPRVTP